MNAPCWSIVDLLIGFGLAWTSVVLLLLVALWRMGMPWSDLWPGDDGDAS